MEDKVQKIREEVVRLKEETSIGLSEHENGVEQGRMEIINALSLFIDSMDEETVSKDLEEAMNRAADETRFTKAKNGQPFFSEVDFNLGFSNGAQWQKQQTITKACDWLKRNADSYTWYNEFEGESGMTEDFIDELKKAIQ